MAALAAGGASRDEGQTEKDLTMKFALIRIDVNSNTSGEIISQHRTEEAAQKAANKFDGTTGEIGLYVAHKKADGEWESRLEARDRRESSY